MPEKPQLGRSQFLLDSLPLSEIDIPLQINLKPFYGIAERNVATIYTSPGWPNDFVVDNCDTRYMYRFKRGPFQISTTGNVMNLNFTGSYIVAGSQRICTGIGSDRVPITPWTPTCTCGLNEAEPRVQVGFRTTFNLLSNYAISTHIEKLEPKPIDKCTVCFWKKDITPTVMKQLKEQLEEARVSMQDSINGVNLRPRFQELWNALSSAIKLYGMGYLQINPEKLRLSTFYSRNDTLNLSIGISDRPQVTLARREPYRTVVPDISDFRQRKGFNIFIDAIMNYDSLSNLLSTQLGQKRIDLEKTGKYIIMDRCELYGVDNESLIIRIHFSGSEKGILYLTGKPFYDAEKHQLELRNIDYDIRTKDLLLRTARWLFNRKIINELNKYSKFNLNDYTKAFLERANVEMNRQLASGVYASGSLQALQVINIYPFTEHLVIRCNATGELAIRIESQQGGF